MTPNGTITTSHLWKRFRADRARRLLRDRISEIGRMRGRDKWRWVLRDIDLEIEPGSAVGLVGANGSGKSTLLKILTGVMYPYAGNVEVTGRLGALLEVRAGLHPDLSGRENIHLYGTLLGFERKKIEQRFDDIVQFADLEDAIDRQVKFYSSGMQMRLGFSVAAFLEPDVLLVDEALAVGDAFFQQRCLERMRDLLAMGTTLVLVSHDLAAVESVCRRGVWLLNGEVAGDGPVRDVLGEYRRWIESNSQFDYDHGGAVDIVDARVRPVDGDMIRSQSAISVRFQLSAPEAINGSVCLGVSEGTAAPIFIVNEKVDLVEGLNELECQLPHIPLAGGRYFVWFELTHPDGTVVVRWHPVCSFRVHGAELLAAPVGVMRLAPIQVESNWRHAPLGPGDAALPAGPDSAGTDPSGPDDQSPDEPV
jgi:ABC-type polysaccharide/polyol phosphate transport system ATPase subunit